jgi:hypothetical protein
MEAMTMSEFKRYRRAVVNAQNSRQPPYLWLILKRSGAGKHDFSPIGKAVFRGLALPFKSIDWRNYRVYIGRQHEIHIL